MLNTSLLAESYFCFDNISVLLFVVHLGNRILHRFKHAIYAQSQVLGEGGMQFS